MKSFDEYILSGDVKKVSPDLGLARSLLASAQNRVAVLTPLPLTESSATVIFENYYEALRELCDAILAVEGFKSYSHIASIVFLKRYAEFSERDLYKLDNARQKRNQAKYYGKQVALQDTYALRAYFRDVTPLLTKVIKEASNGRVA